jgi:hypothetical protein
MPSIIDCPACQGKLRVPAEQVGQPVKVEEEDLPQRYEQDEYVESDRPSRRRASREEEDELPPSPRSVPRRGDDAYEEDGEDNYEEEPRSRRSRVKPGKALAIGIMMLVGGIHAVLLGVGLGLGSGFACCLWPGTYYSLVVGILAIIKGSQLLSARAYEQTPPKAVAIMQIINIVNVDIINCVLGIVALAFLGEPEIRRYFRRP